ncbi:MAG: alpha/beta hydrolase [Pseudomarimonas sp.]
MRSTLPVLALALGLAAVAPICAAQSGNATPAAASNQTPPTQQAPIKKRSLGSLQFEPCSLAADGVPGAVEAQCTTLEVPENRADPDSRRISLALAWIPSTDDAEPDPIFMIAGGPGQSAKESYPMVHAAFRDLRRTRNVLLLDARGTGGSHPLICRNAEGKAATSEGDAAETNLDIEAVRDFAKRCADTLGANSDLRHYGTSEHIDDIEAVRLAIAAPSINLIGISYGTRVAQQYAARYPATTRAVVLDSVAPNTLVLGNEHATNLQAALEAQFARCRAIKACAEQMGDPSERLAKVGEELRSGTLAAVRYRDSTSGEWREETPTFGHLAILLRMYAYSPEAATILPYLLAEAANGRYEAMLAQASSLGRSLTEQMYHGMQLSVMCTEDADEFVAREEDRGSVMGVELIEFAQAQCSVWPRGTRDPKFRQPLSGDLPVLLISGEFDPVTPPRYADEVAKSLPNSRALVLPGQGHSVVGIGCMPKLFAQFIETRDAKKLDAKCLERLQPLPPFAGAYGWEP